METTEDDCLLARMAQTTLPTWPQKCSLLSAQLQAASADPGFLRIPATLVKSTGMKLETRDQAQSRRSLSQAIGLKARPLFSVLSHDRLLMNGTSVEDARECLASTLSKDQNDNIAFGI